MQRRGKEKTFRFEMVTAAIVARNDGEVTADFVA